MTEEFLVAYDGYGRDPGIAHVVAERDVDPPRVVVGQLDDNPGTSVTNAIERVAAAVSRELVGGRDDFELYEYRPRGLPHREPTFLRVVWKGGRPFRMPAWEAVDPATDEWLQRVRERVSHHPYTTETVRAPLIDATTRAEPLRRLA